MIPSRHAPRRRLRAAAISVSALAAIASGCSEYKQTRGASYSIWDVQVTKDPTDVAQCRLVGRVDSRDSAKGCGLTVQPTPEECLRYQVRRAGGNTLLVNGPMGDAYDCPVSGSRLPEPPPATPSPAAPAPTSVPEPPAPRAPTPEPTPGEPRPSSRVRITADREAAKGCVYLGDLAPGTVCEDQRGEASGACADQALQAGGDLIVREAGRAQIFSCRARP